MKPHPVQHLSPLQHAHFALQPQIWKTPVQCLSLSIKLNIIRILLREISALCQPPASPTIHTLRPRMITTMLAVGRVPRPAYPQLAIPSSAPVCTAAQTWENKLHPTSYPLVLASAHFPLRLFDVTGLETNESLLPGWLLVESSWMMQHCSRAFTDAVLRNRVSEICSRGFPCNCPARLGI